MELSKKISVIIAEDDTTFATLLKYRLDEVGYNTYLAQDGLETLNLVTNKNPDIIVCDIMMPFISGLDIVEKVRTKLNKQTPIIIFSSAGQEETALKAFELGANDFISKPFSINELLVRINRLIPTS